MILAHLCIVRGMSGDQRIHLLNHKRLAHECHCPRSREIGRSCRTHQDHEHSCGCRFLSEHPAQPYPIEYRHHMHDIRADAECVYARIHAPLSHLAYRQDMVQLILRLMTRNMIGLFTMIASTVLLLLNRSNGTKTYSRSGIDAY